MNKDLHIAFTGGGTGGHIQPIVSLIQYAQNHSELSDKCKHLYRFGEKGGQEEDACKTLKEVFFVSVLSGKLRRDISLSSIGKNIVDVIKVVGGVMQSLWFLKKYHISVVFCKGGYVALPVCLAAYILGIPIIMHESDMHAGLTNRIVAKLAQVKFVGFSGTFSGEICIGQILSGELLSFTRNISNNKTQLLVMGGSQGAASIFDSLIGILESQKLDMDIHVLLGTRNQAYEKEFQQYNNVTTYGFLDQKTLSDLYYACDVAVTRGSVTSLAEQQLFGIKKIIIPLPWTGGNHQWHNALRYSDTYEDIVVEQDNQLQENVRVFLKSLEGYKKEPIVPSKEEIEQAKLTIREHIVHI